jgi:hypothetical protein
MPLSLVFLSAIIAVLALAIGLVSRGRTTEPVVILGRANVWRPWLIAGVLLVCETIGVLGSFYITRSTLASSQNTIALSLIVAAANFAGGLTARGARARLTPAELFVFFKDGFLWPAALPTLAHTLGLSQ